MTPKTQVDLLRILQDREMRRLGGTRSITVDVRFIAATNRDLKQEIEERRFREDLYYRLNVVPIAMPPLRERREDIPLLLDSFLREFCTVYDRAPKSLSERTLELLSQYAWPGNIRELRNLVERLVLLSRADRVEPMDLPEQIRRAAGDNHPEITLPLDQPLKEAEKQIISSVLSRVTHNRTLAARILGISLRALHYKIKRFGLSSN